MVSSDASFFPNKNILTNVVGGMTDASFPNSRYSIVQVGPHVGESPTERQIVPVVLDRSTDPAEAIWSVKETIFMFVRVKGAHFQS